MAPGVSGLFPTGDSSALQATQQDDHAGTAVVQHHAPSPSSQSVLDNTPAIPAKECKCSLCPPASVLHGLVAGNESHLGEEKKISAVHKSRSSEVSLCQYVSPGQDEGAEPLPMQKESGLRVASTGSVAVGDRTAVTRVSEARGLT